MQTSVHIAITMDDGSLVMMAFATSSRSPTLPVGATWSTARPGYWDRPPTDATIRAELAKAFPPFDQLGRPKSQPVSFKIVPRELVPADRTYRNAWRFDGAHIYHDMTHARQIHLDRIRGRRLEHLGKLDRDWMRAVGQGDTEAAAAVEAERQALRDAPETLPLDTAMTVEELKQIWPKGLPR